MREKFKTFAKMTAGSVVVASGVYFFNMQNGFSMGGVSGLSIILGNVIPFLSPGLILPALNLILLILGFVLLGRKNGMRTVYCSLLYSGLVWAFELFIPLSGPMTDQPMLELMYSVLLSGIGSAVLFDCGASSGGTDIIALILKKYTSLDIGRSLLISDFVITVSSFFVFGIKIGLFSLLGLFAKTFILDGVIENMNECKSFMIITENPEPIISFITQRMRRSATSMDAEGGYTGDKKKAVVTLCRRMEAIRLKKKIRELDPKAFVIVTSTSEIIGRGFRSV